MLPQVSAQNITLRPAIATDVNWAAPLLFASGPELFSYVFASPSSESAEILQRAFAYPAHAFSYEHAQIVEVAGQPVGLMVSYSGTVKRKAESQSHQVMAQILSLRKLPRILVNLADLTRIKQEVAAQEYYILSLSILPSFRNLGIGRYLLAQAEHQARIQTCESICLDVTFSNSRAQSLFRQTGYQIACSKTTVRFDQMTRAGGLHRMTKSLI